MTTSHDSRRTLQTTTARSPSPAIFRSASVSTSLLLGLMLGSACAASEADESDDFAANDRTERLTAALLTTDGAYEPAYSDEELTELAGSPDVMGRNTPFANAPAADSFSYVAMPDGVRLAVALYFPKALDQNAHSAPAIYVDSWYGRNNEATGVAIDLYREAGFVVVLVDSRGFGASFGAQPGLMTLAPRSDQQSMLAWISEQSWSNGKAAVVGISLSATLGDIMTGSGAPSLGAAVLRSGDFDAYALNMLPGGIPNLNMQGRIMGFMSWMSDQTCANDLSACSQMNIAPVDADHDLTLLQAATSEHRLNADPTALGRVVYRDDRLGAGSVDDMSPAANLAAIDRARVPARVTASWLDGATAQGALDRFVGAPNTPMQVFIGSANHMGGVEGDPFELTPFTTPEPAAEAQYAADVSFVKRVLSGGSVERFVRYHVLGANTVQTTTTWPPADVSRKQLHFSRHGLEQRAGRPGRRTYRVDPTTSAGAAHSRWASQYGEPVYYGDRRELPGERISFDATPMSEDTELVGAPELCLVMRSDQTDGIVIAYLEDVAPDGRVTYLTEGELRLLHRKTRSGGCAASPGTERSFERADASAVTPGERMEVELPLLSTAALIRKGHSLRVSLVGADEGTFPLLSESPARWSISYGAHGSTLIVPLKPWSRTNEGSASR